MVTKGSRVMILASASGLLFLYCYLNATNRSVPTFLIQSPAYLQHDVGFSSASRWMESLHTIHQLKGIFSASYDQRLSLSRNLHQEARFEFFMLLGKLGLQCSILLFLYQHKCVSRRLTIPCMGLCAVQVIAWKMLNTSAMEVLSSAESLRNMSTFYATLLPTLFTTRYASMMIVNAALGYYYLLYFQATIPKQWRRIPRFLGNHNLILSTLYISTSIVSLMSISSPPLRSLSEAAVSIENLALTTSILHLATPN